MSVYTFRLFFIMLVLSVFSVCAVHSVQAQEKVGSAHRVVKDVYGGSLAYRIKPGADVKFNERIQTGKESAADLTLLDGSAVVIGPDSKIILDDFVIGKEDGLIEGAISLTRGVLRFVGSKFRKKIMVKTPTATIGIRGTAFDVHVINNRMALVVYHGDTEVTTGQETITLKSGDFLEIDAGGTARRMDHPNADLLAAIAELLMAIQQAGQEPVDFNPSEGWQGQGTGRNTLVKIIQDASAQATIAAQSSPSGPMFKAAPSIATADLLRMNLPSGPVIIELRPNIAPLHVRRIKELVSQGFYDGLTFHRVVEGFVAQGGDPTGTGRGGSGRKLPAEVSSEPYERGSVGMARGNNLNSGDSQFFIVFDDAPSLVGAYTQWGKVISGMEHVDAISKGEPPAQPTRIISMELGWSGEAQ